MREDQKQTLSISSIRTLLLIGRVSFQGVASVEEQVRTHGDGEALVVETGPVIPLSGNISEPSRKSQEVDAGREYRSPWKSPVATWWPNALRIASTHACCFSLRGQPSSQRQQEKPTANHLEKRKALCISKGRSQGPGDGGTNTSPLPRRRRTGVGCGTKRLPLSLHVRTFSDCSFSRSRKRKSEHKSRSPCRYFAQAGTPSSASERVSLGKGRNTGDGSLPNSPAALSQAYRSRRAYAHDMARSRILIVARSLAATGSSLLVIHTWAWNHLSVPFRRHLARQLGAMMQPGVVPKSGGRRRRRLRSGAKQCR
ncbi:hypothetical protein QBC35DRAFT_173734 [Podospora australis]|uniref:Uncharacterized protein n=1 Tax=Podospora australis TaxID=1536484 RepID=A0AAN6WYR5_9PEZI|nr:hypothetical protein QBC35DRAFT_173734 [Podospora australis]